MSHFWLLFAHELRMLMRQQVVAVAAVASAVYLLAAYLLPAKHAVIWLPAILISEVVSMGVLFIAGMLFIEQKQRTAIACAVAPVSTPVWILSKVAAYTFLPAVSAQLLLLFPSNYANSLWVSTGVVLTAALYTQLGFAMALWSGEVRVFILPLTVVMGLLGLSIYWFFGVSNSPLFWLIPSFPGMLMLASGSREIASSTLLLALIALLVWNYLSFRLCLYIYHLRVAQRMDA